MQLINKEEATKLIKPGILAALSQVPIVSAFSTFYSEFVNSNWQEKEEKVQAEIIDKFSKLDEQFESKIRERTNFASLLGSTYQAALKDIDENKIPLYVNSLINAINDENIDNTKVHIFLNFLKDFTILHIKALSYFNKQHNFNNYNPMQSMCRERPQTREEYIITLIETDTKEFSNHTELLETILNDLYTKGLIQIAGLGKIEVPQMGEKRIPKYSTFLGSEFLSFIEEYSE